MVGTKHLQGPYIYGPARSNIFFLKSDPIDLKNIYEKKPKPGPKIIPSY
jgi:hypothetical protein